MGKQMTDTKPYDSTFKTLMYYCTDLLVSLINYAFGEQFSLDAAVTSLQSEAYVTDKDGERRSRISDLVFRLMEHMFQMEFQSCGDRTMEIRLIEMGFGAAMHGRKIKSGLIVTEYPRQVVIYLTGPKNTPDVITMRMTLPSGVTVEWLIPVIKLSELSLDEICDRGLYVLLPFCLFWYGREGLKRCNDDESRLEGLRKMVADVRARLYRAHEEGHISDFTLGVLLDAMEYVSRKVAAGCDNVIKAVDTMMGTNMPSDLIEFPTIRRLREAREEGINEGLRKGRDEGRLKWREEGINVGRSEGIDVGRREGILSTLVGLVRDGLLEAKVAAKRAGLSLSVFNAKMAEYEARPQA